MGMSGDSRSCAEGSRRALLIGEGSEECCEDDDHL